MNQLTMVAFAPNTRPPKPRYDLVSSLPFSRFISERNLQATKSSSRLTDPSVWGYSQKKKSKMNIKTVKMISVAMYNVFHSWASAIFNTPASRSHGEASIRTCTPPRVVLWVAIYTFAHGLLAA